MSLTYLDKLKNVNFWSFAHSFIHWPKSNFLLQSWEQFIIMDNLTINNESFVETLREEEMANCTNLTDYESKIITIISWALEYVCILFIGITGFLGNCIAIYILTSSEKMNSAFNKGWIMNSLILSKVRKKLGPIQTNK